MSLALLVLPDTDASVFGDTAKHLATLNNSVLALLSCRLSEMVSAPEPFFNAAREKNGGVYSEVIATGGDRMGMIRSSMGNLSLTNLLMANARIDSSTARLYSTPR